MKIILALVIFAFTAICVVGEAILIYEYGWEIVIYPLFIFIGFMGINDALKDGDERE